MKFRNLLSFAGIAYLLACSPVSAQEDNNSKSVRFADSLSFSRAAVCMQAGEEFKADIAASENFQGRVSFEVYRFDIMKALKLYPGIDYSRLSSQDFVKLASVLKFDFKTETEHFEAKSGSLNSYQSSFLYNLGRIEKKGVYIVKASAGDKNAYQLFSVSDIGLSLVKSGNQKGCIWAFDSKTGRAVSPDKALKYSGRACEAVRMGRSGIIDLELPADHNADLYVVRKNDSTALCFAERAKDTEVSGRGFLECSVRRASGGSRIKYRGYVSDIDNYGVKEIFSVNLTDLNGNVILSEKTAQSFDGQISGLIKLPENLKAVPYLLVLKDKDNRTAALCSLGADIKSSKDFSLHADTEKTFYKSGDDIEVVIELKDKNDLPVKNADIKASVSFCEAGFDFGLGIGCLGFGARSGFQPLNRSFDAKTDASGKAVLRLKASDLLQDGACRVIRLNTQCAKTDSFSSCSFIAAEGSRFVSIAGNSESLCGSEENFLVQLNDWRGAVLAGASADADIFNSDNKKIKSIKLKADSLGQCRFSYKFTEPGQYRAEVRYLSEDAEQAVCSKIIDVKAPENKLYLECSDICSSGSDAEIKLKLPSGAESVFVTAESGNIVNRWVFSTKKRSLSFSLPVSEDMGADLNISASCAVNGKLQSVYKNIKIDCGENIVNLDASLDVVPAKGQNGSITIKASEKDGTPAEGLVCLALTGPKAEPLLRNNNILSALYSGKSQNSSSFSALSVLFAESDFIDLGTFKTNENGLCTAEVKMPDLHGSWTLSSYIICKDGKIGCSAVPINIFEKFDVKVNGPSVLNNGDFACFTADVKNTSKEAVQINAKIKSKNGILHLQPKGIAGSDSDRSIDLNLAPGCEEKLSFIAKSVLPGMDSIIFEIKDDRGTERCSFPVTVNPMTAVYRQSLNSLLIDTCTLNFDSFSPEFIGRVFDRALNVELINGANGLITINAENLTLRDPDGSASGYIARLAVPVICTEAFKKCGFDIPEYFKISEAEKEAYADMLCRMQNQDGGFGWHCGLKSDPRISAFVLYYARRAEKLGLNRLESMADSCEAYLKNTLPKLSLDDKLYCSLAVSDFKFSDKELAGFKSKAAALSAESLLNLIEHLHRAGKTKEASELRSRLADAKIKKEVKASDTSELCRLYASALNCAVRLGASKEEADKYVDLLALCREEGSWCGDGDTLAALDALSSLLEKYNESPESPNYGIWINGNELEIGSSLEEKSNWHRHISLKVAQLPDSSLSLKFVKDGNGKIWAHAYESLCVHGIKGAGYFNSSSGKTISSREQAPFFIENFWNSDKEENKRCLAEVGSKNTLYIKVKAAEKLEKVTVALPVLCGFKAEQVNCSTKLDYAFDESAGCLYVPSLEKGSYVFKVLGTAEEQGEFSAMPARMSMDGNCFEYAQAAPFSAAFEKKAEKPKNSKNSK